jgi:hypothetical protein
MKKNNRCKKVTWFIIGSTLTVAGFIVIPSFVKKYGNKVYKNTLHTDEINFDNLGPKIVQLEEKQEKNDVGN